MNRGRKSGCLAGCVMLVVPFTLGAGVAGADEGYARRVAGGDINGYSIDDAHYEVWVSPGDEISGTIKVEAYYAGSAGAVVPFGYTVDWGLRENQAVLTNGSIPHAPTTHTVSINKTAPTTPGDYHIIIGFSGRYTIDQVMSETKQDVPGNPIWYDGNDVGFDWTSDQLNDALFVGTVDSQNLTAQGYFWGRMGATAVVVHVEEEAGPCEVLFEDDFSGALSNWTVVSEGDNTYYAAIVSTDGNPAPSLFLDDLGSYHCFANSTQTFSHVGRNLEISVDFKHGNAASGLQRHATFRLTGPDGLLHHDIFIVGMGISASTNPRYPNVVNCTLRYDDNGTDAWENSGPLPIPSGDGWHTGTISIHPDGIASFYLDGVPVYTSAHPILSRYDGEEVIQVGSRKSFYDNVRVAVCDAPGPDCNNNGIPDDQDITDCDGSPWCSDCNNNAIPDECDIAGDASEDCQPNGVPDECEHERVLFEDDFANGLSQWTIVSEGDNTCNGEIVLGEGNPEPALLLDDLASYHCFANSNTTFSHVGRVLEISADLKHGNASSTLQRHATFRLTGPDGLLDHDIFVVGMGVSASTNPRYPNVVNCTLRYDDNGVDAWETSGFLPIPSGDGWHRGTMLIQRDGRVEFYLDDEWVYTSTNPIISRFDGQEVVQLGSRRSFYDNVRVTVREMNDCNGNGIPDECDITDCVDDPACDDCNGNGVPDGCEDDCDGDGLINVCDPDIDNDGVLNGDDVCDYTPSSPFVEPDGSLLGDFDGDCDVDLDDFALLQKRFTGPGCGQ